VRVKKKERKFFFTTREKTTKKKKKREKRGRALENYLSFPLSPVLLPHILFSLFVSVSREKRTTEKTRESPRRRERERDFLLSLVSSRGGCRHPQTDEQKKEEESIFFFSVSEN